MAIRVIPMRGRRLRDPYSSRANDMQDAALAKS